VHISRVFMSDSDHLPKFAFSAPLFAGPDHGGRRRLLGVVVAMITTAAGLGFPGVDQERTIALVGLRETLIPPGQPPPPLTAELPEFPILFHPGYCLQGEQPIGMPDEQVQAVVLRSRPRDECPGNEFRLPKLSPATDTTGPVVDDYRDPVGNQNPKFKGRWLAAFARVGGTGLVVGVQQKYDKAITPGLTLALDSFLWDGVAIVLIAIVVGIVGYFIIRRVAGRSDHRGVSTVEN
jgi:hypothetical protein